MKSRSAESEPCRFLREKESSRIRIARCFVTQKMRYDFYVSVIVVDPQKAATLRSMHATREPRGVGVHFLKSSPHERRTKRSKYLNELLKTSPTCKLNISSTVRASLLSSREPTTSFNSTSDGIAASDGISTLILGSGGNNFGSGTVPSLASIFLA